MAADMHRVERAARLSLGDSQEQPAPEPRIQPPVPVGLLTIAGAAILLVALVYIL